MNPTTDSRVENDLSDIAETGISASSERFSKGDGIFLLALWYVAHIVLLLLLRSFAILENFSLQPSLRYFTMASSEPKESFEKMPTGMAISLSPLISFPSGLLSFKSLAKLKSSLILPSLESVLILEPMELIISSSDALLLPGITAPPLFQF